MGKEPVMWLVAGGTTLVQALLQFLIAFGVPINSVQQTAITTLVGVIVALMARTQVTPVATLPPGVAGKIADANAAEKAAEVKVKP